MYPWCWAYSQFFFTSYLCQMSRWHAEQHLTVCKQDRSTMETSYGRRHQPKGLFTPRPIRLYCSKFKGKTGVIFTFFSPTFLQSVCMRKRTEKHSEGTRAAICLALEKKQAKHRWSKRKQEEACKYFKEEIRVNVNTSIHVLQLVSNVLSYYVSF